MEIFGIRRRLRTLLRDAREVEQMRKEYIIPMSAFVTLSKDHPLVQEYLASGRLTLSEASDEEIEAELQRRRDVREAAIQQAAQERAEQDLREEAAHLTARFERVLRRWSAKHRPEAR